MRLSKNAAKWLDNADNSTAKRIIDAIKRLPAGDVIPLKGSSNEFRLRIGKYRVVFTKEMNDIYVTRIDSRGGIYKGLWVMI